MLFRILLVVSTGCYQNKDSARPGGADTSTHLNTEDVDGDGHSAVVDCDDLDPSRHPNAEEVCDGIDNDCDEQIDEDASDGIAQWPDEDGDGYGSAEGGILACTLEEGFVDNTTDCNDADNTISPDGNEICDEIDNNCDGIVDEYSASDSLQWFTDHDSDGFGSGPPQTTGCVGALNEVDNNSDCDDDNPSTYPGAEEVCDEMDNDCDGEIDEPGATGSTPHFIDADEDGFGDSADTIMLCAETALYVAMDGDCDDGDTEVYPAAAEICDEVDNDCSGFIDEGCATLHEEEDAYWSITPTHTGGASFSVGDLSGDGVIDLATTRSDDASFTLYEGPLVAESTDPSWTVNTVMTSTGFGGTAHIDDIDGDGHADLLTAFPFMVRPEGDYSELRINLGPVDATLNLDAADITLNTIGDTPTTWNPLGTWVEDLTGDGTPDVLLYVSPDRDLILWPNPSEDGTAEDDSLNLAHFDYGPVHSISTNDFNGDGQADLIIGYPGLGQVELFDGPLIDEEALSTPHSTIYGSSTLFATSLCSGDLMGDGHTEIAIATRTDGDSPSTLEIFSQEDDWTEPIFTVVGEDNQHIGSKSMCGDVDGDGNADLLSSHQSAIAEDGGMPGQITLFHGPLYRLTGATVSVKHESDRRWTGASDGSNNWLGVWMSAGDFNDDGVGDLMAATNDDIHIFSGEDWISAVWGPAP
jgi:hypothetical protein